ncbi:hypothetical protein [Acinetobacter indicus]|uniref:Lipoprotein n=1 Tax=Acinetobacter indicus TaxID=756892 RepID=A0AAW8Z176_9GAMM|nr:hypothetical protein [Acinetobacter indicus]MDV4316381.1 hypothetical protein [Acinetobacter indicus]
MNVKTFMMLAGVGVVFSGCVSVESFSPDALKHFASPQELIAKKNLNQTNGSAKAYVYDWGPQRKELAAESLIPRKYMGSYCQSQQGHLKLAYKSTMSMLKNSWSKKLLATYRDVNQGIGAYRCVRKNGPDWIVSIEPVSERKRDGQGEVRIVHILTQVMTEDEARRFYRSASSSSKKANTNTNRNNKNTKAVAKEPEPKETPELPAEKTPAPVKAAPVVAATPQQQQMKYYVAARRDLNSGRNELNACNSAQRAYNYGRLQGTNARNVYAESGILLARCLSAVPSFSNRFSQPKARAKRILQELANQHNHAGAKRMLRQMK